MFEFSFQNIINQISWVYKITPAKNIWILCTFELTIYPLSILYMSGFFLVLLRRDILETLQKLIFKDYGNCNVITYLFVEKAKKPGIWLI